MSRARIQLEPAWVLKRTPYGDTSLLIEAFSRGHGRVGLLARGARQGKSRTRALLQAFQPLLLSWNESGGLGTLTGVEAEGAGVPLSGEQVFSGWYLNELLLRLLTRHDAHPVLFDAYGAALAGLNTALEPALRRFERELLGELGFGLDLPDDLDAHVRYRYLPGTGPVPVSAAGEQADLYSGATLIALRDDTLHEAAHLREARHLLRAQLAPHLGARPLASAAALRALRTRAQD